jgi:LytS/YehU family sensor histidine kinase
MYLRGKDISTITEYHESSNGKPTALWYLVPLFFGVVGGLVGYVGTKYEDTKMAKNLLLLGVVVTVVYMLLLLTLLIQFVSVFFAAIILGGVLVIIYYGLPEVPTSTT